MVKYINWYLMHIKVTSLGTHMCTGTRNHLDNGSMSPNSSIKTTRKTLKRLGGAHQIAAVLVALSLFLAQTMPMAASVSASEGGWISICSGDGVKLIQMDGDIPNQGERNQCPYCLISSNDLQGNLVLHAGILNTPNFTKIIYGNPQTIGLTGPEQYWSACRGPPIASKNSSMTTPSSLPVKEQIRVLPNAWSAPCL
ncbi:hypothetical protein [Profundibacter sp.]